MAINDIARPGLCDWAFGGAIGGKRLKIGRRALPLIVVAAMAVPVQGQKPALAMLDQLDAGRWELRERGAGGDVESLCLDNGRALIQLRHAGFACSSVIVQDEPHEVTVQYTCRGHGYGRTHIRRESNSLVQLDSQGIVNGLPFSFAAEGRRAGTCKS